MRTIYETKDERVALIKRGFVYSVRIAGHEYGPFNWTEALAWYSRHRREDENK